MSWKNIINQRLTSIYKSNISDKQREDIINMISSKSDENSRSTAIPGRWFASRTRRIKTAQTRITSYNVCYTKLLRDIVQQLNRKGNDILFVNQEDRVLSEIIKSFNETDNILNQFKGNKLIKDI